MARLGPGDPFAPVSREDDARPPSLGRDAGTQRPALAGRLRAEHPRADLHRLRARDRRRRLHGRVGGVSGGVAAARPAHPRRALGRAARSGRQLERGRGGIARASRCPHGWRRRQPPGAARATGRDLPYERRRRARRNALGGHRRGRASRTPDRPLAPRAAFHLRAVPARLHHGAARDARADRWLQARLRVLGGPRPVPAPLPCGEGPGDPGGALPLSLSRRQRPAPRSARGRAARDHPDAALCHAIPARRVVRRPHRGVGGGRGGRRAALRRPRRLRIQRAAHLVVDPSRLLASRRRAGPRHGRSARLLRVRGRGRGDDLATRLPRRTRALHRVRDRLVARFVEGGPVEWRFASS